VSNIIIRLGTNQIDLSQTGIPYFKHDFGYEFGVVYPVNTRNGKTANPTDSVSIPVIHEFSKTVRTQTSEISNFNTRREHSKTTTGEGLNILLGTLDFTNLKLFINRIISTHTIILQ